MYKWTCINLHVVIEVCKIDATWAWTNYGHGTGTVVPSKEKAGARCKLHVKSPSVSWSKFHFTDKQKKGFLCYNLMKNSKFYCILLFFWHCIQEISADLSQNPEFPRTGLGDV